ncbi:pentapeptide repeat-containing protein [Micromonospora sp. WMMA1998]|uniref:pentapeptide repeat-containing protein n=1 Tax=Micromonospora sp. WMMA1998 TaxID=3015167 RepID=UPI00248BEAF9|nr:pentapeptide repeat-containing protein [Micromonospora sp. WMMA1998]WBC17238.1 pentapeptide repeat-containing protein [Micromonospora sp. WMMA1998]
MTKRVDTALMAAGALGLLAVGLALLPGSAWTALSHAILSRHWVIGLAILSLIGLFTGWLRRQSRQGWAISAAPTPPRRPLQPLPSWLVPAGAALIASITLAAVRWLEGTIPHGANPIEKASLQVEAIKTGLSIGAGAAGALALLLALRRQQLAERTQQATEYDAGEKRVTELYVKAADQLGAEKAPVRLSGLYALERLAQDNPAHRQSIIEVICAYLRMPYSQPTEADRNLENEPSKARTIGCATPRPLQRDAPALEPSENWREERQVRIAAQRILAQHLRPLTTDEQPNPFYWDKMTLDLSEATLVNFELEDCVLHNIRFDRATFIGPARFQKAVFNKVGFEAATFNDTAWFNWVTFADWAWFKFATFGGDARFELATFTDHTMFCNATFSCEGNFREARFLETAWFAEATFGRRANFLDARFEGELWLDEESFPDLEFLKQAKIEGFLSWGEHPKMWQATKDAEAADQDAVAS